jgi:hypothetical protein
MEVFLCKPPNGYCKEELILEISNPPIELAIHCFNLETKACTTFLKLHSCSGIFFSQTTK